MYSCSAALCSVLEKYEWVMSSAVSVLYVWHACCQRKFVVLQESRLKSIWPNFFSSLTQYVTMSGWYVQMDNMIKACLLAKVKLFLTALILNRLFSLFLVLEQMITMHFVAVLQSSLIRLPLVLLLNGTSWQSCHHDSFLFFVFWLFKSLHDSAPSRLNNFKIIWRQKMEFMSKSAFIGSA